MARYKFSNMPHLSDVEGDGQDVKVSTGTVSREDANGTIQAGPGWQNFVLRAAVPANGELRLKQIAVAASQDWPSKLDQESQWPRAEFTLDNADGWNVSYSTKRLLVDGWRLQPSPTGAGWEEVLVIRAFQVERRRRGQRVITFKPGAQ